MEKHIALLRGDGIGPEIVDSAVKVLEAVAEKFGHTFTFTRYLIGGAAIDETGNPLPQETIDGCLSSDSVLLGAVGGPKWDSQPANLRPEKGLLGIRAAMGLYTNLRPAKLYPTLKDECPLRSDIVAQGFDLMMVRELTGGIYFGERGRREGQYGAEAYDTERYSVMEIERIRRVRRRPQAPQERDFHRQGERAGNIPAVARDGASDCAGVPGRDRQRYAGGQRRHAACPPSEPVRCRRDEQHVR